MLKLLAKGLVKGTIKGIIYLIGMYFLFRWLCVKLEV